MFIPFIGYSKSGKTKSIESLLQFFKTKGLMTIALKHTSNPTFSLDTEGKNTWRYRQAGAVLRAINNQSETGIMLNYEWETMEMFEFIKYVLNWPEFSFSNSEDPIIVICEGFRDLNIPHVLCSKNLDDIESQFSPLTKIISGAVTENPEWKKYIEKKFQVPVINTLKKPEIIYQKYIELP